MLPTDNDKMEAEEPPPSDGKAGSVITHAHDDTPNSPSQPIQTGRPIKTFKCAFCRKDHKKCVRTADTEKCERCRNLNYSCFGALETAVANSPKRTLNYIKCSFCRDAKQKCLPEDRVWPEKCDRCKERNLTCTEPGITRKRPRVDSGPARNIETETHLSRTLQPSARPIAIERKLTPQPSPLYLETQQPLSTENPPTVTIGIPGTDKSNLAILSHAATIHRKDNIISSTNSPTLQSIYPSTAGISQWLRPILIRLENVGKRPSDLLREGLEREPVNLQDRLWPAAKRNEHGRSFPLEEIGLGHVGIIRKRSHLCSFCRLVWNAAQDQVADIEVAKIDTVLTYATWQIDGRQLLESGSRKSFSTKPQNRRIRLRWSQEVAKDPDSPFNSAVALNDSFIVLVADGKRSWDNNFLGRPIDITGSITTITKDWIERCQRYHPHNIEIPAEQFHWEETISPSFRLIDVGQMKVVIPEQDMPQYVALSYAWGRDGTDFFISREQAGKFHRLSDKRGVANIWSELPRTIQDAIDLVKALEFRYLWVDVLCTIFDDLEVDHRAIAQIFSKSFLTICAADGTGQNAGLKALHTARKEPVQHIEKCPLNIELMVVHPAETYIGQSEWNRRGWTFQERYLSTRCLIFVADRVYWECRDANASEDIIEDSREPGWSIDMIYNPLRFMGDLRNLQNTTRAYMQCVGAYSMRQFHRTDDVLKGFGAVGNLLGHFLKTELIYGLPSSFLDLALLWEFKEAPNDARHRQSPGTQKFPTWSWAAWERPITYKASTLSGISSNIPSWIATHTWISWYVRDRYNITRLLHKSGQEPKPISRPSMSSPKPGSPISKFKREGLDLHERSMISASPIETREIATQFAATQPVKWPAQNRSMFFKSVPGLQFDTMDIDTEHSEDIENRDTKYLQFWTWSGFFRLDARPFTSSSTLGPGLWRFGILDYKDDFCGMIVLDHEWAEASFTEKGLDATYEFVAISEAKNFDEEEFDGWTYYIPKQREESEWDLWYVLLVEKVDDVVVRRVGLGKVFQEAFENSCVPGKEWREFVMA